MKKIVKKIIEQGKHYAKIGAIVGLALMPLKAQSGSLELSILEDTKTTDIKAGGNLGKGFGYFFRSRMTSDNDDNVYAFSIGDLTYKLGNGINAVGEVQRAPGMGLIPRVGIEGYKQIGPIGIYGITTHSLKGEDNVEAIVSASVKKALSKDWTAIGKIEGIVDYNTDNFSLNNRNYAISRLRLGAEKDGKEIGFALDVSEGSKPQVGVYGTVSF